MSGAMTAADYQAQLAALLPPGAALSREPDGVLMRLLGMPAAELARVEARGVVLLDEADPRVAEETLTDWERAFGLPDDCVGEAQTLQERRAALLGRIAARGGQSRAYFIGLAASLGYQVSIEEFAPFLAGSRVGERCGGLAWRFVWRVRAPAVTVRRFRAGRSAAGERLQTFGNALLECVFGRLKPAHTTCLFAYGS